MESSTPRTGFVLSAEETQVAYGALQELLWRSQEGDDTAKLSLREETLRKRMEVMLGCSADGERR